MKLNYEEIQNDLKGFEFDKILKETFYNSACDYRNLEINIIANEKEFKIKKVSNDLKTFSLELEEKIKEAKGDDMDLSVINQSIETINTNLESIKTQITSIDERVKALEEKQNPAGDV